jgi:energy-coupling factor transporter ATP-binding protein EcfA2
MTTSIEKSMLYSSFNARALNPVEVASTFIPPPEFLKLTNCAHTLVVGPRGSGKTTLLKMLQQAAIESWEHELAHSLRTSITFTGVFIPTDVTFTSQLEAAVDGIDGGESIIRAAYTLHALRAVMAAIEYRCGRIHLPVRHLVRRIALSDETERELIASVSHSLQRSPRTLSFASFRAELASWLTDIFEFAQKQKGLNAEEQQDSLAASGFLRLDIVRTTKVAIDAFEVASGVYGEKWAFLCDELELAPKTIVSDLFRLIRSTDDRIFFKLSLSPCTAGSQQVGESLLMRSNSPSLHSPNKPAIAPPPEENEDFETIRLWFPYKKEGFSFAKQLAQSVVSGKGLGDQSIDDILGHSAFDSPDASAARSGSVYSPGSSHNKRMKRLASIDSSFSKYLEDKHIDLNKRIRSDDERAKTLRKINGLVIVREAFRKDSGARGRKNPTLYTGASAFFSICEANPRLLIGLLNQLLSNVNSVSEVNSIKSRKRVSAVKQAEVFKSATARFRAYLRTILLEPLGPKQPRGLLSLVDSIGKYFHEEVVVKEFDDDPDTSFIVDSAVSSALQDAIQRALNAGALIWVPDKSDGSLLTSLSGKRFRLSYLLAPFHQLPLQLGRAISLHRVLDQSGSSKVDDLTPRLFDWSEEDL